MHSLSALSFVCLFVSSKNIIFLKSLSTHSLFLRAPYVDQERSESLCGETQWKVLTSAYHCWHTTMESADVSMPLFDAQQWKVLTSACHCLTHNNGNVNHSTQKCKSLSTQSLYIYIYIYIYKPLKKGLAYSVWWPISSPIYHFLLYVLSYYGSLVIQLSHDPNIIGVQFQWDEWQLHEWRHWWPIHSPI